MSERIKEHLSALLDDELAVSEVTKLVDRVIGDEDVRNTLARYQLISAGFRGEWAEPQTLLVSELVRQRLDAEPTVLAPNRRSLPRRWKRGAAGLAIAASVATLAVVIYIQQSPPVTLKLPDVAQAPPTGKSPVMTIVSSRSAPPVNQQQNRDLLERYLMEHNEFATRGGASGFIPYTTFVTYNGR